MQFDGVIEIATGFSAKSKVWRNTKILYSNLIEKLRQPQRTAETYKAFMAASKEEQSLMKDVGGYVGGYLKNGRRNPQNVVHRQLLTLDIDFANLDFWGDFCLFFENAAILHSTRKHSADSPRYRLLIPLDRPVNPDEYGAIARYIAGILNIDLFDNTTFEVNRLMFWPSCSANSTYVFETQDGPWLIADKILAAYSDWRDTSLWPMSNSRVLDFKNRAKKQQDPESKEGPIGLFCQGYTISDVIAKYLSDEYSPTIHPDRYTYRLGTTSGGLIIYDDKFAYSHHGTDPISGQLCNAFDLVRIHRFGALDNGASGSNNKSFQAMLDLTTQDENVKMLKAIELTKKAKDYFNDGYEYIDEVIDIGWMTELTVNKNGQYLSNAHNVSLILANDAAFKDNFKHNILTGYDYKFRNLPWVKISEPTPFTDVDDAGIRNYLSMKYQILGRDIIRDCLNMETKKNEYHPVCDYLNSLKWDGKPRLDNVLIDYFGAEDIGLNKEISRKFLTAAVYRAFEPGYKFDYVLILAGEEGTYKSTFFKTMGDPWYSDTMLDVTGKTAFEQIQGVWIMELAELAAFKKAETEHIKHFVSKTVDEFRPAYGVRKIQFKRQCVFGATTNELEFIIDTTGNRRFWPVLVNAPARTKHVFDDLPHEKDQIWAEAVQRYREGEALILSKNAESDLKIKHKDHFKSDERLGFVERYLETLLPDGWDDRDVMERRMYLETYDDFNNAGSVRERVCAAEIWCECLNFTKETMNRYATREVNELMRQLPNWRYISTPKIFKHYGKQKYYVRKT